MLELLFAVKKTAWNFDRGIDSFKSHVALFLFVFVFGFADRIVSQVSKNVLVDAMVQISAQCTVVNFMVTPEGLEACSWGLGLTATAQGNLWMKRVQCILYINLLQTFCRKIIGQGQVADCNSKYISYKLMSFQDVLSGKPWEASLNLYAKSWNILFRNRSWLWL